MQVWFNQNIEYVNFIYGLSFIVMGTSIIVLPKKESKYHIGKILWLLALYCFTHSIADFITIFSDISEETKHIEGLIFTSISYLFLFEFGRRLINLSKAKLPWWLLIISIVLTLYLSFISSNFINCINIYVGYFIRLPAGLMITVGMITYYNSLKNDISIKGIKNYFVIISIAMFFWTILCGIFRNEGDFFPANIINTTSFFEITGFPIQIFRTITSIITTISLFGVFDIFKRETILALNNNKKVLEEIIEARTIELKNLNTDLENDIIKRIETENSLKEKEIILQKNNDIQEAFYKVLILTIQEATLDELLKKSLTILLSIKWLAVESKGAIFLVEDKPNVLILKSSFNLHNSLLTECQNVEFGKCLCGKAALKKEIIFKKSIDDDHDITYEGIMPHGHFCIPILSNNVTIGVINIYIKDSYEKNDNDEIFLKSYATIVGKAIENIKDKTYIKQLNKNLVEKNKNLEQFAYITSHDLQEPLRTISSFVDLINEEYSNNIDENFKEYLEYITNSTNRMRNLIKSILEYSRLGRQIKLEQIDCNNLIKEIINDLNTNIKETNAKILFNNLPVINANTIEIRQLFQNLITNAIKFRKKDIIPEINIEGKKENNHWLFSVEDNGIGIDNKYNEKVFQIFQRLHNRDKYEGLGIGLAFCKKIVEIHQGDIWIKSTKNKGSIFYFTILCNLESKNLYDETSH